MASPIVLYGIPAHALLCAGLYAWLHARATPEPAARRRVTLLALGGALLWLAATGAVAASGVLARFDARPPPFLPFMAANVALGVALGASRIGKRLAQNVPLALLIGVHAFRLPLELVMHQAAAEGVMPPQMTFTGLNFEIVTGALALPVALLAARGKAPRGLLLAWNALGITTLLGIAVIAVASTPLVHAFGTDAAHLNTWVAEFPYVWLPAGPVVFAIAGHVVLTRALRAQRRQVTPDAGSGMIAA